MIDAIRAEFLRYKALAEKAIAQLDDAELSAPSAGGGNSIATICWHVSGNLRSRFTDFLTTDGEKPWRQRDEEFEPRSVTQAELLAKWEQGWDVLLATLAGVRDDQMEATVTIRGQALQVREALLRALGHVSYHVGQMVYAAKAVRGSDWDYLSIPPGKSDDYNRHPALDRPPKA
ncbi:MAG: DinB family protein [Vicinamibacterales bacterium]